MKELHSKKVIKHIILIIAILMLCNFVVPKNIYAEGMETDGGGAIFDPVAKFITHLCDRFFQFMQESFVSVEEMAIMNINTDQEQFFLERCQHLILIL